jgi:hypothetical protein
MEFGLSGPPFHVGLYPGRLSCDFSFSVLSCQFRASCPVFCCLLGLLSNGSLAFRLSPCSLGSRYLAFCFLSCLFCKNTLVFRIPLGLLSKGSLAFRILSRLLRNGCSSLRISSNLLHAFLLFSLSPLL